MHWLNRRISDLTGVVEAARLFDISTTKALRDFMRLAIRDLYSPTEILRLGLLDAMGTVRAERYISCERLLAIQRLLNADGESRLTEDKLAFYAKCLSARLPSPRILGVYGKRGFVAREVPAIASVDELIGMLESEGIADFVLKPVDGVHGTGVLILRNRDRCIQDHRGRQCSPESLVEHMECSSYRTWIAQERIHSHLDIVDLSGTSLVQTLRLVTYVDQRGNSNVILGWLRMVAGSSGVDNFDFGQSGNVVGSIDLESGVLEYALKPRPHGHGLMRCDHHPVTDRKIAGFRIPMMREAFDLALEASRHFLPLRTIGWDIAVTDRGPSLIEGNVTWDPLPTEKDIASVVRTLA